jgi:ABC-2 type transport system permease protein
MTTAAARAATIAPSAPGVGSFLRGVYIVWWRDIIRFWRDRVRLVASFAQPLLYLVVFGSGLSASLGRGFAGGLGGDVSYTQFIYPGVISMTVLFTAIFGAMSIVWDREFGFMKELLVAPIDRTAIAVGKALGGTTQALLQGAVLLLLAPFLGVTLTPTIVLELLGLMFVLAFGLASMGVAIAARTRSMQGFQVVMNFLMLPMLFLSGALFPLVGLPGWLTVVTRLDPASYGIDPIRRVLLGGSGFPIERLALTLFDQTVPIAVECAIVIAFGLVMLGIGALSFQQRD